jgi:formylglycine-generating enzyme required for sulfatase activity
MLGISLFYLFFSLVLAQSLFCTTYVWEDYDDFSGSTLDTSKWEVGYFAGGETVTIDNGKAKLSGTAYSSSSPLQMPSELTAAGQGSTEGNTFMFVKDSNIFGLEAEIMIPNANNNYEAGIYLTTLDSSTFGSLGFELRKSYTGTSFNYDYLDAYGNELSGYESGSLDNFHKIAITKLDGQTSYYLNDNLASQFTSSSHDEDYWSIGSFNDEGLAYVTYTDNVRVLRQGTATTEADPKNVVSSASGLEMIWVEPGTFMMGSPTSEVERRSNETQHRVTLTQGFYLGKYEVTQAQYAVVMTGNSDDLSATPSFFSGNANRPVEMVSWDDIQVFLNRLNAQESLNLPTGWAYVLPTEAQWEYACRAGTTTAYSWGDSIGPDVTNYNSHNGGTLDVGQFKANSWGFYDMHGNVWEWCADRFETYDTGPLIDPLGPNTGNYFTYRGGSWSAPRTNLRSARRAGRDSSSRHFYIGFRVSLQKTNEASIDSASLVPEQYIWEDYDDFSGSNLDTSKWGSIYLGGGIEPHVVNGKLVLSGSKGNPSGTKVVKEGWEDIFLGDDGGLSWVYAKDPDIYGIEAEFVIPSGASSMSGLSLGIASLSPLSYVIVELNAEPNSASEYSQGFGFYHLLNSSETEKFGSTKRDITHKLGAFLIDGRLKLFVDGEVKYEADSETFNTDMFFLNGFNDYQAQGLAFELNADNVRVLRQPTTTQPDPLTVVSDPNGQAVVVQVGEKYDWSDNLDGIILWMVHEDDDDGWFGATVQYVGGMQQGSIGLTDQVGSNLVVNHPYVIDENGMIKVTEDTAFQYYQVTAVENGVIITADDSSFPLSDTSRFFTNRAAAEDYYSSKVPVTVISDPNGKAVVTQLGNEYHWNSTLDGVTLWLVGYDNDSLMQGTFEYNAGNYSGDYGFQDQVTNPVSTQSYSINTDGYLAHTESNGQQYFQILTAENGKIGTIGFMNDLSQANHSSEPVEFFFTTRAAAEEYYYAKVNPKDWMWFDHYPWVYSNEMKEWLYFLPSGGKLMYYSNNNKSWREFSQ